MKILILKRLPSQKLNMADANSLGLPIEYDAV